MRACSKNIEGVAWALAFPDEGRLPCLDDGGLMVVSVAMARCTLGQSLRFWEEGDKVGEECNV
jgi:hypothetical protein